MKKRRIPAALLAGILAASLAGCGAHTTITDGSRPAASESSGAASSVYTDSSADAGQAGEPSAMDTEAAASSQTDPSMTVEGTAEEKNTRATEPTKAGTTSAQPPRKTEPAKTPVSPPASKNSAASRTTTARRTETTAPPTTTTSPPKEKSPWRYPYDVPAILEECKAEIARVGLVWEEALVGLPGRAGIPISLPDGMSKDDPSIIWAGWDNPDSTAPYTRYPDGHDFGIYVFDGDLKNEVFNDLIPYYVERQERYSITCCKIWFEPDPNTQGDYLIYFLFA